MTAYKSPETKIYNTILAKCQYPREASSGVYFARKGKRQHQTPSGLFQSSLYDHRDNLYIISYFFGFRVKKGGGRLGGVGENCYICVSHTKQTLLKLKQLCSAKR